MFSRSYSLFSSYYHWILESAWYKIKNAILTSMKEEALKHYCKYGMFTYPGLYEEYLRSLPDDVRKLGLLVRKQVIHRTTLEQGNTGSNEDMKYGDMTKVPWYRQAEDDYLITVPAIVAELFRRDAKGFTIERNSKNKVVLTCRYVALLMASILKVKGIPTRVRSGFASYFPGDAESWDHWITQYWNKNENRWLTIDVDGSLHNTGFDMYDIPDGKFDYSAKAWLDVRNKKRKGSHFNNAGGFNGLIAIAWELFYDFHCLMNNEIIYLHHPELTTLDNFKNLSEEGRKEIDYLATLLLDPDKNFDELQKIWETKKEYRLLKGALL